MQHSSAVHVFVAQVTRSAGEGSPKLPIGHKKLSGTPSAFVSPQVRGNEPFIIGVAGSRACVGGVHWTMSAVVALSLVVRAGVQTLENMSAASTMMMQKHSNAAQLLRALQVRECVRACVREWPSIPCCS